MDAKKFGAFIAESRKEKSMTQADLAVKLQVTDKAVSRWERGIGFPDIGTIEPLAYALDLSVLEVMKSEKMNGTEINNETAAGVISNTLEVSKLQLKNMENRFVWILFGVMVVIVLLSILAGTITLTWNMVFCLLAGGTVGAILGFAISKFCPKNKISDH